MSIEPLAPGDPSQRCGRKAGRATRARSLPIRSPGDITAALRLQLEACRDELLALDLSGNHGLPCSDVPRKETNPVALIATLIAAEKSRATSPARTTVAALGIAVGGLGLLQP